MIHATEIDVDARPKVSIIGAGPAGLALSAELERNGIRTLVYAHPAHARNAARIIDNGCLKYSGKMEGVVYPRCTFKMSEAVNFSNFIMLTVPSTGQETVLHELKKFDLRQHTIISIPGNLFTLIAEAAKLKTRCVVEFNLSPYSCRLSESGEVLVLGKKRLVHVAASRKDIGSAFRTEIENLFPGTHLKWCHNVVEVCLSNINGVFHPLMMLMNAGRIEDTGGDFLLYHDGLTRSVANAMTALDKVRMETGKALGFQLKTAVWTSNECYGARFKDLVDLARGSGPHNHLKAPADITNRNVSEDVPDVLVPWLCLAKRLGVDASAIQAIVVLAEISTGAAYTREGRNLTKLGLDDYSPSELIRRFGAR